MKKSVKKNYVYNLIYQVFSIITPLLTTPYISRVLGSDGIGQYTFTNSIASYFILLGSLGFAYYAQREIARKQGDVYEQTKLFWEILISRFIMVMISACLYILLLCLGLFDETYTVLLWVLLINIIATAFDVVFLFQGNEEFGTILIRNIVIKCIGIALIFIFVRKKSDVWLYILCQSATLFLSNASLWFKLPKRLTKIHFRDLEIKRHFAPSIKLFIPTLAISIYTMLDKTLIGVLIPGVNDAGQRYSDIENGNYEQSEKIVKLVLTLLTSIGVVMLPRNSQSVSSGNYEEFKDNINKVLRFTFFLGLPLMFGLSAVAFNFSPWFFGLGFDLVPYLIVILSPLFIIIGISNIFGLQYLLPLKKDNKFTISIVVGAVVNLSLNLILIPCLKAYGACIATIIGEFTVTLLMIVFARKDISIARVLFTSWKYFLASILMFASVFSTQFLLEPTIINTILLVMEGLIVYFTILFLLRDSLLIGFINRFLKRKRAKNL